MSRRISHVTSNSSNSCLLTSLVLDNAYVSGMSEELGFHGNQLVQFQTIFTVGNVVGLLPFIYLFPRVPMHYLVSTLDLCWGIFTLLQYRANSYVEIMAYRFLVSIFEVSSLEHLASLGWETY